MKRVIVCVVIYDRIKNLKRWLEIWERINPENAELRIIHNVHPNNHLERFDDVIGKRENVVYIPRLNVGYDIGAFQDVCANRLHGFKYDFEKMIWFTDDTIPINKDFIDAYLVHFRDPSVGITCYEISPQMKKHFRTTGFCLKIDMLHKIHFEVDRIQSKDDCYRFEHGSMYSFYNQVLAMGKNIIQIAPIQSSPVYDTEGGGMQWVDRNKEFLLYWGFGMPPSKVAIIAPAYLRYPTIAASMINQTYENWELHLVHAGPAPYDYPKFSDERIKFFAMTSNRQNFGHPIRVDWLNKVKAKEINCDYVVVTNDDNYHVPHFLEKLVAPLEGNDNYIGSYCNMMVHNYQGGDGYDLSDAQNKKLHEEGHIDDGYGIIHVRPECGYIDCAGVMLRSEIAGNTGWPSMRHSSDWDYINTAAFNNGGWQRMKKVFGSLLVHN